MAIRAAGVRGNINGLKASADLSSYQYCLVYMDAAGTVTYCGAGGKAIGVLLNKPTAGQAAEIFALGSGVCPMKVDGNAGAITFDSSYLISDAAGKGVASTTDKAYVVGLALASSSAAGDIIPVLTMGFTLSI